MEFNYKGLALGLGVTFAWYVFFIYTGSYEAAVIAPLVGGYAVTYRIKGFYKEGTIYGGLSGAIGAFVTALVLSAYNLNALAMMGYTDIGKISLALTLVLAITAGLCMGIAGGLVAGLICRHRDGCRSGAGAEPPGRPSMGSA